MSGQVASLIIISLATVWAIPGRVTVPTGKVVVFYTNKKLKRFKSMRCIPYSIRKCGDTLP